MNLLFRGLSSFPTAKITTVEKLSCGTELPGFNPLSVAWVLFTERFCRYFKTLAKFLWSLLDKGDVYVLSLPELSRTWEDG